MKKKSITIDKLEDELSELPFEVQKVFWKYVFSKQFKTYFTIEEIDLMKQYPKLFNEEEGKDNL